MLLTRALLVVTMKKKLQTFRPFFIVLLLLVRPLLLVAMHLFLIAHVGLLLVFMARIPHCCQSAFGLGTSAWINGETCHLPHGHTGPTGRKKGTMADKLA